MAKRYFTSRGPATLQDFVWWSGLSVADAKTGLEASKTSLLQETFHEQTYYLSGENHTIPENRPSAFLLPGFDEYLLGYKNRLHTIDPKHNSVWCPGNNGMFMPYLVIDSKMSGTWKRTIKKNIVSIETKPFEPLNKTYQKLIAVASKRYSDYIGITPEYDALVEL